MAKQKHKQIKATEEVSAAISNIEDKFDEKLMRTISALVMRLGDIDGITAHEAISAACGIIIMRLVRLHLVAVGVEPQEPTPEEMCNAVINIQKCLADNVYDIGARIFAKRAESN